MNESLNLNNNIQLNIDSLNIYTYLKLNDIQIDISKNKLKVHTTFNLNYMNAMYLKAAMISQKFRIGIGASTFENNK